MIWFFATVALAGQLPLILEIEKLRNSLPPRDPSRAELSLRLADLYFFEGVEQAKVADLQPDEPQAPLARAQAAQLRGKALALYAEQERVLPHGDRRVNIQFQMARLNQDLGRLAEAKNHWRNLSQQDLSRTIRNEAILRLGEMSEDENTPLSLKDAETYYGRVIEECTAGDLCPYVKFRLAWLLRREGRIEAAIPMMRDSLWDAKGGVREDSLRDLIVFHCAQPSNGEAALTEIEALSAKLSRPELIANLADGFFSSGNKVAGVRVLEFVETRSPSFSQKVRLLEELYGLRQWDRFRGLFLETAALPLTAVEGISPESLEKSEKILRRLVVQLDGERISDLRFLPDFQAAVALHLKQFPRHSDSFKLMEGWLASEPDGVRKETQIKEWLGAFSLAPEQVIRLREIRIGSAQRGRRLEIVAEEAGALATLVTAEPRKREFHYAQARAQYELKSMDAALAGFQALAAGAGEPDRWAILSQNLALDILAARKDYPNFLKQAESWLENEKLQKSPLLARELAEMKQVKEQVIFEAAAAAGNSASSLATFMQFCRDEKFKEKSCANAKVLAVALGNSDALIELLRREKNYTALADELERAGRFAEAAQVWEQLHPLKAAKWTATDALKIALLYELGEKPEDQQRWLKALRGSFVRAMAITPSEALVYQTFSDAQMLDGELLRLPWSAERILALSHELEMRGLGDARTQRTLLNSKTALGSAWSKLILGRVAALDSAQRKISFVGRNSRARFQARTQAIQELDRFALQYLEGADIPTRISLLNALQDSYKDFSAQILATPLPPGLEEASQEQIRASLAEMAAPYLAKGGDYARLRDEQSAKLPAAPQGEPPAIAAASDPLPLLRSRPSNAAQLQELKQMFQARGQRRLASYFEGRLTEKKP